MVTWSVGASNSWPSLTSRMRDRSLTFPWTKELTTRVHSLSPRPVCEQRDSRVQKGADSCPEVDLGGVLKDKRTRACTNDMLNSLSPYLIKPHRKNTFSNEALITQVDKA
jgi:hypothetical protein